MESEKVLDLPLTFLVKHTKTSGVINAISTFILAVVKNKLKSVSTGYITLSKVNNKFKF